MFVVRQHKNGIKLKKSITEIDEIIRQYLSTQFSLYDIQTMIIKHPAPREVSISPLSIIHSVDLMPEIPVNASAQKTAANEITIAEKKLTELEKIYNITTDSQFQNDMYIKIKNLQDKIKSNREKISKLKRNANYAQKCKEKKGKCLLKTKR